ncbi:MAG: SCO1664 family protein [Aggregatilineales bacterium]|nr:SCO1664 family protein [Chloroflexota bacterium]HOA22697.1 SCO1664 family protein [Aggregatilineales bacterium]HPV06610.1 SCO1664 family protein [Aggregatilineales bacterium]
MAEIPIDQPDLSPEQALKLLEEGEVEEIIGLLPWGSNHTFLVRVTHGDVTAFAVYKPRRGERPLWDFPHGTLCQRERAAYVLSETLGWGIVPPTVLRHGPEGFGSVQWFVPHDPEQNYFTFGAEFADQVQRIALFDHMVNNADRKAGHCLLDKHGRIWAIDHGVCFNTQPKLRSVIWDFAGDPIPEDLLCDVEKLCSALEQTDPPHPLRELLSLREYEALQRRVARLLETRSFPYPSTGRHYPWPPI